MKIFCLYHLQSEELHSGVADPFFFLLTRTGNALAAKQMHLSLSYTHTLTHMHMCEHTHTTHTHTRTHTRTHTQCPHKSPSPCKTCHIHVIIHICVLINHINIHTHTQHIHTHTQFVKSSYSICICIAFSHYTSFQSSFTEDHNANIYDILLSSCLIVAFSRIELGHNILYICNDKNNQAFDPTQVYYMHAVA